MIANDTSVRDINPSEKSIQEKTLDVLTSLQSMLATTSAKPEKAKTTSKAPSRPGGASFDMGGSRSRGESRSEFVSRILGDQTASQYIRQKLVGDIAFALKPLESFFGWNLKLLIGRGLVSVHNLITQTSESERAFKKAEKKREKEKLAALKEEMKLSEKHLKQIGVTNWQHSRLRDEKGHFVSDEGMTKYQKLKALSSQYAGEIAEKSKSSRARQIEALMGKPFKTSVYGGMGGGGESYGGMGAGAGSTAGAGAGAGFHLKPKVNPTLKDLSVTAPGQSMLWYFNQTIGKKGPKEESNGLLNSFMGAGMASLLGTLLPAVVPFLGPALLALAGGAGIALLVTNILDGIDKRKAEDKKTMKDTKAEYDSAGIKLSEDEIARKVTQRRHGGGIKRIVGKEYVDPITGTISVYDAQGDLVSLKEPTGKIRRYNKMGQEIGDARSDKNIERLKAYDADVEDAIITRSGKVIHTSPQDMIIATKNINGFDGEDLQASANKMKSRSGGSGDPLLAAIKEQTQVLRDKALGNVISNHIPSPFSFDKVRMSMSYGGGM